MYTNIITRRQLCIAHKLYNIVPLDFDKTIKCPFQNILCVYNVCVYIYIVLNSLMCLRY